MKHKRFRLFLLPALTLCMGSPPAKADLFSDLGPPGDTYNKDYGGLVCGNAVAVCGGESDTWANSFSVAGSGSEAVTEIDLAVSNESGAMPLLAQARVNQGEAGDIKLAHRLNATSITDDDLLFLQQIGLKWVRLEFGDAELLFDSLRVTQERFARFGIRIYSAVHPA